MTIANLLARFIIRKREPQNENKELEEAKERLRLLELRLQINARHHK